MNKVQTGSALQIFVVLQNPIFPLNHIDIMASLTKDFQYYSYFDNCYNHYINIYISVICRHETAFSLHNFRKFRNKPNLLTISNVVLFLTDLYP